jgi:monoamine oxidase
MSGRTPLERERVALEQGSKLHPQYPSCFESSFSIAWDRTKHSQGGWAQYSNTERRLSYKTLCEPDGPLYLAGDHLSYLSGWLARALGSARGVAQKIHERALRTPA